MPIIHPLQVPPGVMKVKTTSAPLTYVQVIDLFEFFYDEFLNFLNKQRFHAGLA
jgi:hypothetical protein